MTTTHDQQILEKWGHLPFFRKEGREWKGSCPRCGDYGHVAGSGKPDRFFVNEPDSKLPIIRGKCRKCGLFEFIADSRVGGIISPSLSPEEKAIARQEIEDMEAELEKRRQVVLAKIRRAEYFKGFHDAMTDKERDIWVSRGISPELQDWFVLGYCRDKRYRDADQKKVGQALTIPYLREDNLPVNIAYRILNDESVRYRYEYGLPAAMFIFDNAVTKGDHALVVEGGIKSIICGAHIGHEFTNVIGLPSCNITESMAEELTQYERITLLLDPDTHEPNKNGRVASHEAAKMLDGKAFIATSPGNMKPDDFIVEFSGLSPGKASDYLLAAVDAAVQYQFN